MIVRSLAAFIFAFVMTVIVMPIAIVLFRKLKFRQTILHYVDNHAGKSGTPTMGGVVFVISASLASVIFFYEERTLALLCVIVMCGYAVVGFIDDFIKVFFKQNKGLSAWQKIVFQVIIAVIVSVFAVKNYQIQDKQYIPWSFALISLGVMAVPFYTLLFLAGTNSVNLIDGLDGLASSVTSAYLICFALIMTVSSAVIGFTSGPDSEMGNVIILCLAISGALMGFMCYNRFPAEIFMGDTGSLALGGVVSCIAIVSKMSLALPIIGIMYVLTSLSVIIQVISFKSTGKRVFLMTPLHHHFERKQIHENRIVGAYTAVTYISGLGLLLIILLMS